ncbi:MAG: DoxX family protein [Planctomycetia bacterium]|nr:DoxX family protein [Planctomycetia bacterium]
MNRLTCVFLILLRLAIGWHFLFEGLEKIHSDNWTSAGYLREASGPLAEHFRDLAGDPVLDRMTPLPLAAGEDPAQVPPHRRMPRQLQREWQQFYERFVQYYQLNDEQQEAARRTFEQRQDQTALWLLQGKKQVKRSSAWGPTVDREMTTPERLQEYRDKLQTARKVQDEELSRFGADVNAKLKTAKTDAARVRSELNADLNDQTNEMVKALRAAAKVEQVKDKEPLPYAVESSWRDWGMLQWSDAIVKYGLVAVGICLLIGLLTRSACVAGASFLLLFYLAMPPLLGMPDNPKAEGHYLFINKNIIEMLALLTLATTRSGRWVGLDGLLQFARPSVWRTEPEPESRPVPVDLGAATPRPDLEKPEPLTAVAASADNGASDDRPLEDRS